MTDVALPPLLYPQYTAPQSAEMTTKRLKDVLSHFLPSKSSPAMTVDALPTFDELPPFKNFSGCAWKVWGPDDQLGTVNLLTDKVVQRAAQEEIMCVFCISSFPAGEPWLNYFYMPVELEKLSR